VIKKKIEYAPKVPVRFLCQLQVIMAIFTNLNMPPKCRPRLIAPGKTLSKKKRKFSSYIRQFIGIGCAKYYMKDIKTSSYMVKIFVHFLIY
jgi:hypothetical protein